MQLEQIELPRRTLPDARAPKKQRFVEVEKAQQPPRHRLSDEEKVALMRRHLPRPKLVIQSRLTRQIRDSSQKPVFQRFANDSVQSFVSLPQAQDSEVFEEFVQFGGASGGLASQQIFENYQPFESQRPAVDVQQYGLEVSPTQQRETKPAKPTHRGSSQLSTSALDDAVGRASSIVQ